MNKLCVYNVGTHGKRPNCSPLCFCGVGLITRGPKEWTIEDPAMGDARLLPKAVHGGLDRSG